VAVAVEEVASQQRVLQLASLLIVTGLDQHTSVNLSVGDLLIAPQAPPQLQFLNHLLSLLQ